MRVAVAGATGFVGRRLVEALVRRGYEVWAMTRSPDDYDGPAEAVFGDVHDPESLVAALDGCEAAYYLVHSLDDAQFADRDAEAATAFGHAAAEAGVARIIYLGGLGEDDDRLSAHLASRHETEAHLADGQVPVTTLRAGIIIGHGGVSWLMLSRLVERLPVMVLPQWVHTRCQPIALADAVAYLVGVLENPESAGRTFEIGGPEVFSYQEMLRRVAVIEGRLLATVPAFVPLVPPVAWLSARWVALIAGVDVHTSKALIESMSTEVVVHDHGIESVVPHTPMSFDDAVLAALGERAKATLVRA